LLDDTIVEHETVFLSDLLPQSERAQLGPAGGDVVLGRAPEPGSLRIFNAEQLRAAISPSVQLEIPAQVTVRRRGWPLNMDGVQQALYNSSSFRGLDLSHVAVSLPQPFSTGAQDPRFELVRIHRGSDQRTFVATMRCRRHSLCGSFLVQLAFDEAPAATTLASLSPSRGQRRAPSASFNPTLVSATRAAYLVIQGDGMKITERVFPLGNARLGDAIRVRDPVSGRILLAEVAGEGLLRPKLAPTRKPQSEKKE
jgi:hypothetical protein